MHLPLTMIRPNLRWKMLIQVLLESVAYREVQRQTISPRWGWPSILFETGKMEHQALAKLGASMGTSIKYLYLSHPSLAPTTQSGIAIDDRSTTPNETWQTKGL